MILVQINLTLLSVTGVIGLVGYGLPRQTTVRKITVRIAEVLLVTWMVMSWIMILMAIWGATW